jgi:hypothetical protein
MRAEKLENERRSKEKIRTEDVPVGEIACEATKLSPESQSSEDSESPKDDDTTIVLTDIENADEIYTLSTPGTPFTRLSPSPDSIVESIDIPYLEYFLYEMPKIHPYAAVFPQFIPDLMQVATSIAPLRHSIISLAAVISDTSLGRPPVRALQHHQVTLRQVQALLSTGGVEETTIYVVMLLAYFNIFSGRFLAARRHIRGLSLLLQLYSSQGHSPSSVTMLIWRSAVRMDYFLSSIYPCQPVFPTPPVEQENLHRMWIHNAVTSTGEEWALAQFALDNLQSRAAHLSWSAYQSRHKGYPTESQIQESATALLNDFVDWRSRKLFQEEDAVEELVGTYRPGGFETFLNHPPMTYRNRFYANLLNEFRCAVLFVTFIVSPVIGQHSPYDAGRKTHAIDSCRSMSATGVSKFPLQMVRILQLAGLVFADLTKYPEECAWIERQLDKVSGRGVQAASKVKEMLNVVWHSTYPWTYEDTERVMQNADELEQLELEEVYDEIAQ